MVRPSTLLNIIHLRKQHWVPHLATALFASVLVLIFVGCATAQRADKRTDLPTVVSISSPETIRLRIPSSYRPVSTTFAVLRVEDDREPSATLVISEENFAKASAPGRKKSILVEGKLIDHSRWRLVRVGDPAKSLDFSRQGVFDFKTWNEAKINGRAPTLQRGHRRFSAQYKPLVYQSLFLGETADTLDQYEILIDVFSYIGFGITDDLMVSTFMAGNLIGSINGTVKYRINVYEDINITPALTAIHLTPRFNGGSPLTTLQPTVHWNAHASAKFVAHAKLTLSFLIGDRQEIDFRESLLDARVESWSEYIFDNWNRIGLGPRYNFDQQTVGGFFSYIIVWDRLHVILSLVTDDFTNLTFGFFEGYYPLVSMYWRF